MNSTSTKVSTALEIILKSHPNQSRLSLGSLAQLLDLADQSIRNSISAGTFKIKNYKDGSRRFFDIRDIAEYLEKKRGEAIAPSIQKPKKNKRGRPTKAVSMARAGGVK